ncbi:MAG: hypothetical protein V4808_15365 [Pseudomonadota bacterium]
MHHRGSPIGITGQLRLFVASLWLTLATALFCAVMPAGLPDSVSHGSAFNPANNAVALQAPSSGNRAILKRGAEGDPAATNAGSDIVAPLAFAEVAAPVVLARVPALPALLALPVSKIPDARYPRGPPTA